MHINDVAMVEYKDQWFTVIGYDGLRQMWIVMVHVGVKDDPNLYRQACISDAIVTKYMDRVGYEEWGVEYERR